MALPPPASKPYLMRMKTPANVAHFSINVDDINRARRFYERVFGWRFEGWGPPGFFMIRNGDGSIPGILGSMQQRRELVAGVKMPDYECTIGVADVDAVAAAVVANGGSILLPKTMIPTVGHLIFFRDSEGNIAGAMQYDAKAEDEM